MIMRRLAAPKLFIKVKQDQVQKRKANRFTGNSFILQSGTAVPAVNHAHDARATQAEPLPVHCIS